jgi:hypothetical protein
MLNRRALTNAQWRRIEPLIPGKEGDYRSRCPDRSEGGTARTIDCSWTLCFGWFVPEHHGAICPRSLATGTACSSASADGQRMAFGRVFLMRG